MTNDKIRQSFEEWYKDKYQGCEQSYSHDSTSFIGYHAGYKAAYQEANKPDNDMVERVAVAIYSKIAWAYKWDGNTHYEQLNEHAKEVLNDVAQLAIAAINKDRG